jgi:hypothetical protein
MPILQNAINANATTPLLPIQGGSGVSSPTAHGILVAEGASAFSPKVLTNGQLLIGSTGADPSAATITAGTGISVTNGAGTITIANTEPAGTAWTVVTAATPLVASNGYFANSGTAVTFTLPAVAVVGDTFQVTTGPLGSGGWVIAQNALQSIILGNTTSTVGVGGTITSASTLGDWIEIVCVVANTTFVAHLKQGESTVV